jgi:hypothetical protein
MDLGERRTKPIGVGVVGDRATVTGAVIDEIARIGEREITDAASSVASA